MDLVGPLRAGLRLKMDRPRFFTIAPFMSPCHPAPPERAKACNLAPRMVGPLMRASPRANDGSGASGGSSASSGRARGDAREGVGVGSKYRILLELGQGGTAHVSLAVAR